MSDRREDAPLWSPTAEMVKRARMTDFMAWAGERHGRRMTSYGELWDWSVTELEQFWGDVWEYCGVR
jgi:acetoacetyl-CoA synthetase